MARASSAVRPRALAGAAVLKGEAELDLRDADSSDMELCLFRASRAVEDYMKHLKHEKLKELSVEVDIENL